MSLLSMLSSMSGLVSSIGPGFKAAGQMAIDAFKGLMTWFNDNLIQPIKDFIDNLSWEKIKDGAVAVFEAIWNFIDSYLIQPFASFIELFSWENIKAAGEVTFNALWDVIDTVLIEPFNSFISLFSWDNITEAGEIAFTALWSVIDTIFVKPWKAYMEYNKAAWGILSDAVMTAFKASWAIIDAIFINPLKTAFDLFISAPGKIYSGLADAFSSAWDFVDSIFISPVVGFFDGLTFDNILDGITSAFSSAWDFISGIGTDITNLFVSLGTDLADVLKSPINGFISSINSLFSSLNFSKSIKNPFTGTEYSIGIDLSDWNIPMLAEGGIVTKPTLAMIGEGGGPEAVIPLDKAGGMGTQNFNITVNASGITDRTDKRTLAREIGNMIQQEMARNIGGTTMRGRY